MDTNEFRKHAHKLVDWIADYYENIEEYPVKSQVNPGDILTQLPDSIPIEGEPMEEIFSDFEKILLPYLVNCHLLVQNHFYRLRQYHLLLLSPI